MQNTLPTTAERTSDSNYQAQTAAVETPAQNETNPRQTNPNQQTANQTPTRETQQANSPNDQSQRSPSSEAQQSTEEREIYRRQQEQANQEWYNPVQNQYEESQIAPGMMRPIPEQELIEWKAPSRFFTKRNKKYFTTIIVIGLLVALIFIFAGQGWLPAALTFSIIFLIYILSTIPPHEVGYKLTTYGIRVENNLYYWQELGRFWFETKGKQAAIHIETVRFPGRITLLLSDYSEEQMRTILSEVLLEERPELTFYEKASKWLQEKIPIDVEN